MRIETEKVGKDRRPRRAGVSPTARMLVHEMQAEGFEFTVRDNGVMINPGARVTDEQRRALRAVYHEVKEILIAEKERPQ